MTERDIPAPIAHVFSVVRRALRGFESERTIEPPKFSASWNLEVLTERDELDGGWTAWMANVPGCVSCGDTEEEALDNLLEAFRGVIASRLEKVSPTPDASSSRTEVHRRELAV